MSDAPSEGQDLVGETLAGRYELLRLLGRGGMGAVYEAVQQPLGRKVALKVIRRSLTDEPAAVKRFKQEAQAVAQLSHPNIVTVFDFGQTEEGVLFLAMELLEGKSLQRTLDEGGAMPWERTLVVVSDICRALTEAHDHGIIHRDLKPDNVMLVRGREERVKVVDFGVAKLLEPEDGSSKMTQTGMVVGTPGYISPEQVNGVNDDARSDLYALGVLWFELLTGRAPFEGETPMKVVLRHLHDPAPRPSALATSSVPRDIDALVHRLLAKEPEARAASAAVLLDELEGLSARGSELAQEVMTASLSMEDVRAVVARAQEPLSPSSSGPRAPPSPPPPPSVPTSMPTPATGAVVAERAAVPVAKRSGAAPWIVGCLVIPFSLVVLALTIVSVVTVSAVKERRSSSSSTTDSSSDSSAAPVSRIPPVPPVPAATADGDEDSSRKNEALKKAAGEQLGEVLKAAVSGEGKERVADRAVEGALEVSLAGIADMKEPKERREALEALALAVDKELADDDTSATRKKLLARFAKKVKRLQERDGPLRQRRQSRGRTGSSSR